MLTTNDMRLYEINYKCTFYETDIDFNTNIKLVEDTTFIKAELVYEATEIFLVKLTDILDSRCSEDHRLHSIKELIMDSPKLITGTIIEDNETENAKEDIYRNHSTAGMSFPDEV